jgi:transposase
MSFKERFKKAVIYYVDLGYSYNKVARKFGISYATVRRWWQEREAKRSRWGRPYKINVEEFKKYYTDNPLAPIKVFQDRFEISRRTVYRLFNILSIKREKRGKKEEEEVLTSSSDIRDQGKS